MGRYKVRTPNGFVGLTESMRIDFISVPSRWQRLLMWARRQICRVARRHWPREEPYTRHVLADVDFERRILMCDCIPSTRYRCKVCYELMVDKES